MTDLATLAIEIRTDGSARATRDLHNVERASKQTEKAVDSLSLAVNALKRLMALGIGIQGISGFLQMADTMQSLRTQVKFVTGSLAELNKVQSELFDISQRTRASLESTTQLYVKTSRALKEYGVSQRQVLQFTETINKAMAVGGVGAQEQASALMQLSQALGSGRLQGDEFKTIAETAPIILDVVAEYMGKSRAEVKKLASEGQITSKLLFEAINGSTQKINKQFAEMPLTFGQAMQQMQNAALKFVGDLNQSTNATNLLAQGVSFLAENFNTLGAIVGGLMLAHLAKYGQSMAMAAVNGHKQSLANLQVAKTAQAKAAAELHAARANMTVLASELRLAQTEQTRSVLRARIAQQATLITSLTNAEAVATNNLAAAQTRASIAGRALSGVMGLLGGPAGVITLAAGALFYFSQKAEQAREKALDTAGANDRLKESYEGLSEAALSLKIRDQLGELENYQNQIRDLTVQINTLQQNWHIVGLTVPDSVKKEIEEITEKIAIMQQNADIDFSVFENQLDSLAKGMLASGKSLDEVRAKFKLLGIDVGETEWILAGIPANFKAIAEKASQAEKATLDLASAQQKLAEKSQTIQQRLEILKLKSQGNTKASFVLAGLYEVLGVEGAKYAEVLNAIATGQMLSAESVKGLSAEMLNQLQVMAQGLEGLFKQDQEIKEIELNLKTTSGKDAKHKEHLTAWKQHYDELHRASVDGLARIALEEERAKREMLEKAKNANASYEEIEKAKTLIAERYAKERQAIAEKYAPQLKFERELKEQLVEINALEKGEKLTAAQANNARDKAKWHNGEAIAKQAGQDAVSGYDRWKEQFDPMQAIKNEQTTKLAEQQSMYDQQLIQYEDFVNAKAQIDAKAAADTQNLFLNSISGFGSAIDTMLGVMKNAGMEQSGIYKAMFAASKAFAIAESIIKIQQGIANAASLPFPSNLGAMATVASQTASIISTIQSTNLKGMAHSGIDNIPREGTWLLDKGERVVDSRTNADLKTFLKNQSKPQAGGKSSVNVKIINNGQPVNAQVESQETEDGLALTVTLLSKMNEVANNVYTKRQQQDLRSGGMLRR